MGLGRGRRSLRGWATGNLGWCGGGWLQWHHGMLALGLWPPSPKMSTGEKASCIMAARRTRRTRGEGARACGARSCVRRASWRHLRNPVNSLVAVGWVGETVWEWQGAPSASGFCPQKGERCPEVRKASLLTSGLPPYTPTLLSYSYSTHLPYFCKTGLIKHLNKYQTCSWPVPPRSGHVGLCFSCGQRRWLARQACVTAARDPAPITQADSLD